MALLTTKPDLLDDPDWSDPAEVEPPAERQFDLRASTRLTFRFRAAGGDDVAGAADVEVFARFPLEGGGRPSWGPLLIGAVTSDAPQLLRVGGYVRAAIRFTNIAAAGATRVEVEG